MDVLFLDIVRMPQKSRRFLNSLYRAAKLKGFDCDIKKNYEPCRILVIYGLGGNDRFSVGMNHLKNGGVLLSFDLGYWDRKLPNRKYRFSLNGLHPTQVMDGKKPNPQRFNSSGLNVITSKINQNAPILLIGNAPKSIAIGAENWTAVKSKEIRKAFPYHKLIYRPKPNRPIEKDVDFDKMSTGPIEEELKRVSLVVCRHSNVAVDACLQGIPVVCDDGAAACIYPNKLEDYLEQPSIEMREEFLERLAYWQWAEKEVKQFWNWFCQAFPDIAKINNET